MSEARLLSLVEALRVLPGVGVKSAQRMAFHLLDRDRNGADYLRNTLAEALQGIERCHTFTEHTLCDVCADPERDANVLCIVETPADQSALERTGSYKGLYFVLMGRLSPLDGVGVRDIGVGPLLERIEREPAGEVILATSFTAEGEATAHVIGEALKARGITVSRLARGVPAGSELEYVDLSTIAHALADRR